MNVTRFVENVRRIAESNPTYRTGGDGSDGTCDCIGLIMGALGREYPMHSTNYFARFEMAELAPIRKDTAVELGNLVYKTRDEGSTGYDLHERYKQGGRYFASTLLDYYHVGVVTSVDSLVITHCTQTDGVDGIDYDTSLNSWTYCGEAADVEYEDQRDDDFTGEASLPELAVVYSEDREPVRMRSTPATDAGYNTVVKVPFGAEVIVRERTNDWATVQWNGKYGFMQTKFLRVIGMAEPTDNGNGDPMSFEDKVLAKLDEILMLVKGGEG